MSVRVRFLEARDEAAWRGLFEGYIQFYQANVAADVIAASWRALLSGTEGAHLGLVAVDAHDHPIGLAHVLFHRSTWSKTCYCYLEDLFVAPAARGQGVGRTLIEAVYREADKRGASRTYWATQEFNYTARTLYDD